jgi:hypothetical protein
MITNKNMYRERRGMGKERRERRGSWNRPASMREAFERAGGGLGSLSHFCAALGGRQCCLSLTDHWHSFAYPFNQLLACLHDVIRLVELLNVATNLKHMGIIGPIPFFLSAALRLVAITSSSTAKRTHWTPHDWSRYLHSHDTTLMPGRLAYGHTSGGRRSAGQSFYVDAHDFRWMPATYACR